MTTITRKGRWVFLAAAIIAGSTADAAAYDDFTCLDIFEEAIAHSCTNDAYEGAAVFTSVGGVAGLTLTTAGLASGAPFLFATGIGAVAAAPAFMIAGTVAAVAHYREDQTKRMRNLIAEAHQGWGLELERLYRRVHRKRPDLTIDGLAALVRAADREFLICEDRGGPESMRRYTRLRHVRRMIRSGELDRKVREAAINDRAAAAPTSAGEEDDPGRSPTGSEASAGL